MPDSAPQQLLHLVIGGELTDLEHTTFKDLDQVEIVRYPERGRSAPRKVPPILRYAVPILLAIMLAGHPVRKNHHAR